MSKRFCMVVGCTEHPTEHVELESTTADNNEIWTDVHICQSCESLLDDYFNNQKPITFDGFLVESVSVLHETPNRGGFSECIAVGFKFAEEADVDACGAINVCLFDKEPLHIDAAMVDVESD